MNLTEHFLVHNSLHDPDDIDSLLELADLFRQVISDGLYSDINRLINYTVEHGYYEAFSWCMGIMQEVFEAEDCTLHDFECVLGKSIPDYDEFTARLQVDLTHPQNDTETVCDNNGEVTSFFNILVYETAYPNIRLVSFENFDTKDNDYIQYKLSFARQ